SILSVLFFVLIIIGTQIMTKNSGMGWGDVKLGAALGLWLGLPGIFYALVSAFILGAIFGVILLITKQKGRKDAIPFGPFLAIGAILAQSNFF
ncbi:MAG: A24 family peptidase, partial [Patescibacteria group bacterium]